jgi:hypothetical protein
MPDDVVPDREVDIPDRALQSALEFAVLLAAAGQKTRPALSFPPGLKPFLKFHKLPPKALATVREVVEADPEYLRKLGIAAQSELVDEVGMLWLQRPSGWLQHIATLVSGDDVIDDAPDARAERRRREAAESAAARSRLEVVELTDALARLQTAQSQLVVERDRLATELRSVQRRANELDAGARKRAAGDRVDAGRADAAAETLADLRSRLVAAETARDAALASRADEPASVDVDRMRTLLLEAVALTGPVAEGAAKRPRKRAARTPVPIPGGVYGNSEAAAEHLFRAPGMIVLVDGYNVAKLGWPDLSLERQRDRCIEAAETLARRWGTDLHVVFDGADVVGGHTRARRLVRVVYSPEGVLADDVLRAEVAALDSSRSVVVVTNDQAVLHDVKASGANTVSSDVFLAVART